MVKKIVSLGILLVMLFGFSACGTSDMQRKITELEGKITQQTDSIAKSERELQRLRDTLYNNEIVSICRHEMMWGRPYNFKLYDFKDMAYSEKIKAGDDYEVKTVFTKEAANLFIGNIKAHGIFLLDEFYEYTGEIETMKSIKIDDETSIMVERMLTSGVWYLDIAFDNGIVYKTGGRFMNPPQESELNRDFLELSGFTIFNNYEDTYNWNPTQEGN